MAETYKSRCTYNGIDIEPGAVFQHDAGICGLDDLTESDLNIVGRQRFEISFARCDPMRIS